MLPLLPVASALGELASLEGGGLMAAALQAAPGFVQQEVSRLLPQLAGGDAATAATQRGGEWRRERLFAGVAELLTAVARGSRSGLALMVEDVHWADSETLDFLTFLGRAGRRDRLRVVVTCRSDEAPVGAEVAGWLAHARAAAGVDEIRLSPLSRAEVSGQVAILAGGPAGPEVVDELFMRAEGNPFFTEQLVAAALAAGAPEGGLHIPVGLPGRLADVLAARAARCGGEARVLLNAMAVIGGPVDEELLGAVTGLDAEPLRRALQELAEVRLLADDAPGARHRPRNVLLAEAVVGGLLPGERVAWHERTGQALARSGGEARAAQAAGHLQAAGRPAEELLARVTAAGYAERVFGFAEAARHWRRAIELWPHVPHAARVAGIGLPRIYVAVIDALQSSGDREHAGELAEEAHCLFAGHEEASTAAVVCHRAALFRSINTPTAGRPLLEEALRLFEQAPPSAEHAAARFDYALTFLHSAEKGTKANLRALLHRALEVAEAAEATSLIPSILTGLAYESFLSGQVEAGRAILDRARALARTSGDGRALLRQAIAESDMQLKLAEFRGAAEVGRIGVTALRQAGLEASFEAGLLAANAAEALLALGRTAEAAAVIDPLTNGPPDLAGWVVHEARAEVDLLRGHIGAAERRRQQIKSCTGRLGHVESARESALRAAELALWARLPDVALGEVQAVLGLFPAADFTIFCGRLLTAGMWACADLAEHARARRDRPAIEGAFAAAAGLVAWVAQMGGSPFIDHPFVVTIPAERAAWEAERTRVAGRSDPRAWAAVAQTWDSLGCPHRAAYAWWRDAQAQLEADPRARAAATLRAAAVAADGHEPLRAEIQALAERARISLHCPAVAAPGGREPADTAAGYGLTEREGAVLRLVAAGRTNAQIGSELFISPRTAGVHVTNILRKLGVSGRVQAAAVAERAGLLDLGRDAVRARFA
jgi:DNA-binding CsgD family transcriptional regulator